VFLVTPERKLYIIEIVERGNSLEDEMVVALVFKLQGSEEHPLPDPIEWSMDLDNVLDHLLPYRELIGGEIVGGQLQPRQEVAVLGGTPQMAIDRVVLVGEGWRELAS
jgi:hypothetical protein